MLFDYDHLLKNICNLWLTEKNRITNLWLWWSKTSCKIGTSVILFWIWKTSQTFRFKWNLHCSKANRKTHGFLFASVYFLRKTYNALLTQQGISVDKNDTALFINKALTLWKILNVKSLQIDKLHNNPLEAEIRSPNDTRLDFIIEFGKMALNMVGSQGNRKKKIIPKHCYCHTSD